MILLGNATPLRDSEGRPYGAVAAFVDITARKKAEEQRDLVIAELSHRVKNTLAIVTSIARQTFSNSQDVDEARRSFDARIRALGQTHSRLAEGSWSGVRLKTLLQDELAPYAHKDGRNVRLEGPPTRLSPRIALTLGLALHELATNAAKYGALSSRSGSVEVCWAEDAKHDLHIRWTETGGPAVAPPTRRGFGRLLLERALASNLGGVVDITFANTGLQCSISIPLHEQATGTA
jgi:two-component sensor histidine kinase